MQFLAFYFALMGTVLALEPLTVAVGMFAAGYKYMSCAIGECCGDKWIKANISGML
jgi:hypothetical protein